MTQGDAGRQGIGHFQRWQAVFANINHAQQDGSDEASIKDQPPLADVEQVRPGLPGEFCFPEGDDVKQTGPDEPAGNQPGTNVGHRLRWQAIQRSSPTGCPEACQKADGDQDAVPVDGHGSKMKGNRLHRRQVSGPVMRLQW